MFLADVPHGDFTQEDFNVYNELGIEYPLSVIRN